MADGPSVSARLSAAQGEARRAADGVRRISAARLVELLRLPPAERLGHLDETSLVDADRAALRRSLQASLTRGRRPSRYRFRFRLRGPRARRLAARVVRLALTPELVLPLLLAVTWLGLASTHTAQVATLTRDVPIRLAGEDGRLVEAVLPKGGVAIVGVGWNGAVRLRHWLPGRGYETVPLPPDAVAWGRPSRTQAAP